MVRMWGGHGTYMDESRHTLMSHDAPPNESGHTYKCVMAHIQMRHGSQWRGHGTYIDGHGTHKWVVTHIQMGRVTHTNASWHSYVNESWLNTYICVTAMSMRASEFGNTEGWVEWSAYEWVACTWTSHVTQVNESWHTRESEQGRT